MAAACDVIYVTMVTMKTKEVHYMCQYHVNPMNGDESRGEGSDWPPPPMPSCNFLWLKPFLEMSNGTGLVWLEPEHKLGRNRYHE